MGHMGGLINPHPEPVFQILVGLPTLERGHRVKKGPSHYKLWVRFFGWELEGTGADTENTTSAQHRFPLPRNPPPKLGWHYRVCYDPAYPKSVFI